MKSTELHFPLGAKVLSADCKDLCQKLLRRNPGMQYFVAFSYLMSKVQCYENCRCLGKDHILRAVCMDMTLDWTGNYTDCHWMLIVHCMFSICNQMACSTLLFLKFEVVLIELVQRFKILMREIISKIGPKS